ncbi:MAG: hypothetical protein J0665_13650 [Deltaproteobacteria bacterium]|nr:hypothetical protein [Deltaproteobacteria bacterium]
MKKTKVANICSAPASKHETGYSTMSGLIAAWNIPEAQGFYSDELAKEDEQGANLALAEYILSDYGKGVKFVSALLNNTVLAERYFRDDECEVSVFYAEGYDEEDFPGDGSNGLVNITAQIVFQLDKNLEQMEAFEEIRISILKKVENALEEFIDAENPDKALLSVYAACVEQIEKIAREFYVTPGTYLKYPVCLKKCVNAGRLLIKADPESERYRKALAYYLNLQGDRRKGKAAGKCYLESLEQLQILQTMGNESSELLCDLSVCYANLGDSFAASEPLVAREWYMKCLHLRKQLIEQDNSNYKEGMFVAPLRMILALNEKCDVPFYEKVLAIADKAGDCAPEDTDLQLLINMIVSELLKSTGYGKTESSRNWYKMEAKALERVVAKEKDIPRYFWWLSDSYRGLAEYYAESAPEQALAFYNKCLDNRVKVIELDGENLCYSCGMRPMLLDIDKLAEQHAPESRTNCYKRWLSIAESCQSLCDSEQIIEHQMDIRDLKSKLAKFKK